MTEAPPPVQDELTPQQRAHNACIEAYREFCDKVNNDPHFAFGEAILECETIGVVHAAKAYCAALDSTPTVDEGALFHELRNAASCGARGDEDVLWPSDVMRIVRPYLRTDTQEVGDEEALRIMRSDWDRVRELPLSEAFADAMKALRSAGIELRRRK